MADDAASIIERYTLESEDHHPGHSFALKRMEDIFDWQGDQPDPPHRHDYYTLIWVKEGTGTHRIDFSTYAIENNQLHFVSPGQIHHLLTPTRPKGWVLTFTREFLLHNQIPEDFILDINVFRPYGESPPINVDDALSVRLTSILEELTHFHEGRTPYKYLAMGALLKVLLIHAHQSCQLPDSKSASSDTGTHILRAFRQAVEQQYRQVHKVSTYAEQLHLSPRYLNEVIKSLTGQNPKQYIQDRLIMEAQRLLLFTDQNVKEIAYHLGFEQPLHFSAFFKKCTGQSPTAFRKTHTQG